MIEPVWGFFAGGEWVRPARGGEIRVVDPANESLLATVPRGCAADARVAAHAARWAFDSGSWSTVEPGERAAMLKRFAVEAAIDRKTLTDLAVRETGHPSRSSQARAVTPALEAMSWYADRAARDVQARLPDHDGTSSLTVREPIGVVAVLAAGAEPLACLAHKVFPALAAGNTVVVKAASRAPLTSFVLARCAERAGLPPGVLNVVTGEGRDVGAELAANTMVDAVSLAGTVKTGRRVAERAAAGVKTCVFTLGASGVVLVAEEADVSEAARAIVEQAMPRAGQAWGAPCRVVAVRSVHDAFVEALAHAVKGLVVGDPNEDATDVGPLSDAKACERAEALVEDALAGGATRVAGGARPASPERGFYTDPTVLSGVRAGMRVFSEEIAAPIFAVAAVESEDDAVRAANDAAHDGGGVLAMVAASGREHALALGRRLRAGTVAVVGSGANPWAPAGGYGRAGVGREGGLAGIDAYTELKHLAGPA